MSSKSKRPTFSRAGAILAAATFTTLAAGAHASGAFAEESIPVAIEAAPAAPEAAQAVFGSQPLVQPLPAQPQTDAASARDIDEDDVDDGKAISASSLSELVAAQDQPAQLSRELQCLAGAIYFEAKSESLPGQLAVGRVVVARSKSGRFPDSYCGVVYQPSQFSFVRGRSMPPINKNSQHWRNAVAIAQIADDGSWRSPVEGALFFHATHVSPGWRLKRLARIDNHIFYR